MKIQICQSCLSGAGLTAKNLSEKQARHFASNIATILELKSPSGEWKVELVPCMDICPSSQITIGFELQGGADGQIVTVSENDTLDSVVQKCLERAKS